MHTFCIGLKAHLPCQWRLYDESVNNIHALGWTTVLVFKFDINIGLDLPNTFSGSVRSIMFHFLLIFKIQARVYAFYNNKIIIY